MRRCPLFDRPDRGRQLGITHTTTVAFDLLHTFYLGVVLQWCKYVIWKIIFLRHWIGRDFSSEAERVPLALLGIKAALDTWYFDCKKRHPGKEISPITRLHWKMIGKYRKKKLRIKAM